MSESDEAVSIVRLSRFTPGLENAVGVALNRGETVTAKRSTTGAIVQCVLESDLARQRSTGKIGYETTDPDSGVRVFLAEQQIVGWSGKDEY